MGLVVIMIIFTIWSPLFSHVSFCTISLHKSIKNVKSKRIFASCHNRLQTLLCHRAYRMTRLVITDPGVFFLLSKKTKVMYPDQKYWYKHAEITFYCYCEPQIQSCHLFFQTHILNNWLQVIKNTAQRTPQWSLRQMLRRAEHTKKKKLPDNTACLHLLNK